MSKPILLVIAGCNGSGKSSFSKLIAPDNFLPFDYDFYFLSFYKTLADSDIRDTIAHNMAFNELENQINHSISNKINFCYETNFNSSPLHWPELFKKNGYEVNLIFFCLNSIDEAKRRVAIRVENGGHFVPENEIIKRYFDGYANLNSNFSFFDNVHLFDTSEYLGIPRHCISITNGRLVKKTWFPEYLGELLPEIKTQIS